MLRASVNGVRVHNLGLKSSDVILDIHAMVKIERLGYRSWSSESSLLEEGRTDSSSL